MGLNLSPGEQVIFEGHPSWRAILGFYLKGILVAVVIGVIAKLVGASGGVSSVTRMTRARRTAGRAATAISDAARLTNPFASG